MNSHQSGQLVVTIEVSREEDDQGDVEILDVAGNMDEPGDGVLSDVGWFRESWSVVGRDLLFDSEEVPPDGRYKIVGHLYSWHTSTTNGDDYDEEFVHECQARIFFGGKRPGKYDRMTDEDFDRILAEVMDEHPASHLLSIAGVYEAVSEEYNNEVLDRWERRQKQAQPDEPDPGYLVEDRPPIDSDDK